jgi:hypothetical protein
MSYILKPGEGLESVATDATLTGDGTAGDPLSVVDQGYLSTVAVDGTTITGDGTVGNPLVAAGGGGGTYSVAKTVFNNGALPPYTTPATAFPSTDPPWFADEIISPDVDFITGDIRFINAGTYRITMQMSFDKLPAPGQEDLDIQLGLTDAPPNPPLYETYECNHYEPNDTGIMTPTFFTVIEATAGQTLQPTFILGGTAGVQVNLVIGAQAGFIIVERVA